MLDFLMGFTRLTTNLCAITACLATTVHQQSSCSEAQWKQKGNTTSHNVVVLNSLTLHYFSIQRLQPNHDGNK